jgi:hypothetical protein
MLWTIGIAFPVIAPYSVYAIMRQSVETADTIRCGRNLKNLALAMLTYEDATSHYPPPSDGIPQ